MTALTDQLTTFSHRYFDSIKIKERETPWQPVEYDGGKPKGATLHFTADDDLDRVCRWFMREKYQAKAAANYIIADRRYPRADDLMLDLPLVAELPTTVIQCAPPDTPTWHATWASTHTVGFELLNMGELRPHNDYFVSHWKKDAESDDWTLKWHHPLKEPAPGWGRYWEPYSTKQLATTLMLLRECKHTFPETMKPGWVIGHECYQQNKEDPGPLLPVHHLRQSMFEPDHTPGWLDDYNDEFAGWHRDNLVCKYANDEHPSTAWAKFHTDIQRLKDSSRVFGAAGKTGLAVLGYHVPKYHDPTMYDEDKLAVYLFQKCMQLKPDKVPGPKTRALLIARLYDKGILVE